MRRPQPVLALEVGLCHQPFSRGPRSTQPSPCNMHPLTMAEPPASEGHQGSWQLRCCLGDIPTPQSRPGVSQPGQAMSETGPEPATSHTCPAKQHLGPPLPARPGLAPDRSQPHTSEFLCPGHNPGKHATSRSCQAMCVIMAAPPLFLKLPENLTLFTGTGEQGSPETAKPEPNHHPVHTTV